MSDTDRALAELSSGQGFLTGISAGTVSLLSEVARHKEFEEGDLLLREGDVADTIYLITDGRVAVEIHSPSRGPLVIDTIESGYIVGLSWIAPPYRWQFDARAMGHVETVAFDAERLSQRLAQHPEAAAEIHQRLSTVLLSRLQAARIRLLDLYANAGRH